MINNYKFLHINKPPILLNFWKSANSYLYFKPEILILNSGEEYS